MTSSTELRGRLAGAGGVLFAAFEDGRPVEPLTASQPDLTVGDAYAVQRDLVSHHVRAGRAVVGRKIGLTSEAIQRQLGVDSPDYGVVLDSHVFESGTAVSRSSGRMIAPRIEAELAFILERPLSGPGLSEADVLAATRSIVPVFELIDSRITDWKITLPDTVADNASCFGVVVGAEVPLDALEDLRAVEMRIERDGVEVASGTAAAVLGHPATAVAWLAAELGRFGESIPEDELILSGSFSAAVDAEPGHYRAVFSEPFSDVEITVAP